MGKLVQAPPAPDMGEFPKLTDYVGSILVLGPTAEETVVTKSFGDSEAVRAVGWAWNGKTLEDLGTVLVFWGRVRAQLRPAIESGDYVVGRLRKDGRAYILDPEIPEATLKAIGNQLDF